MLAILETFFQNFGYVAVFSVLVFCGFGVPIPEDVTLVAGGIISGWGYVNPYLMLIVSLLGVLVGDGIMFGLGRIFGERILRFSLMKKLMPPKRYAQVQQKFDQYGNRVLFVARFLPGLRSPIFLTAGMSGKISFWRWLIMDGLAALISVPLWVYIGYVGAENREWLLKKVHNFQSIIYIVIGVLICWVLWACWRRRNNLLTRKRDLLEKRRLRRETGQQKL